MKVRLFSYFYATVCGAALLSSCSSEIAEEINTQAIGAKQQMTFSATQENNINSRTSLASNLNVLWTGGDAVKIFDGTGNDNSFTVSDADDGQTTAQISGYATPSDTYYALYPYQAGASQVGSAINNVTIPSEQKAVANSFDPKANVMTALSDESNVLLFKNVCAYAKITTTMPCNKIVFTAGNDDKISGNFNLTLNSAGEVTNATPSDDLCKNTVTLTSTEGKIAVGTYYIAIKPGTISSLDVQCIDDDRKYIRSMSVTITAFTRGAVIDLGISSPNTGWREAVNLGTSNVWWATMNVGAQHPHEYGDYFAWAATEPWYTAGHAYDNTCTNWIAGKTAYDWYNTPYQTANTTDYSQTKWTKYLGSTTSSYKAETATDADAQKTVLDPDDDAAHVNWGGNWRMPTYYEQTELRNNCYWVWTTDYNGTGVKGYIVYKAKNETDKGKMIDSGSTPSADYSLSDYHIFLPAAGYRYGTSLYAGPYGFYWSSSLNTRYPCYAYRLKFFYSNNHSYFSDDDTRDYGRSVRAVCSE